MPMTTQQLKDSYRQAIADARQMSPEISGIVAVVELPGLGYAAVCVREAIGQNRRIVSLVAEGFGVEDIEWPDFGETPEDFAAAYSAKVMDVFAHDILGIERRMA